MLHHVSVGVSDVVRAAEFYDAVLGALGYKRTAQYLPFAIAYGEGMSEFWIQLPHDRETARAGNGAHVGFSARSRDAVHRFHQAALGNGGADEGAPGPRPDYGRIYGAFVRDPFGNKVEATLRIIRPGRADEPGPRVGRRTKKNAKRATVTKTKSKARRPPGKAAKRKARRR